MDDTTTTEAPVEPGAPSAQPEPAAPAEAVQEQATAQPEQQAEQPSEPVKTEEPSDDEQLATWAENKGLTLDSENAKKAAKMAREAERAMHAKAQKAGELEKAAKITDEQVPTDATPEQKDSVRMRNLELKFDIQQWKLQNPEKLENEAEMVSVLSDPVKKALVQEGYLTLDDVYHMARGGNSSKDAELKSQGKREALESLAHKQQAAVPTGNATTSEVSREKPFEELSISEMEAKLGFARR